MRPSALSAFLGVAIPARLPVMITGAPGVRQRQSPARSERRGREGTAETTRGEDDVMARNPSDR